MKYKVGDRVRIKSLDWYNENKTKHGDIWFDNAVFVGRQSLYCGCELTIRLVTNDSYYVIENDYYWTDEMIEGLVEEEIIDIDDFQDDNEIIDIIDEYVHRLKNNECQINLPEGYQFTDENGNVINAMKIVLKKKKEVILTQEQIDTMVHESCVLFCKHCGCGVPRETCTSLGTCKEHDDYRKSIRTHFEKHKK